MSKSYPVNLPNTAFCQRANSAVREPELQRFWSEQQVYAKNTAQRAGNKKFVLHDGPPYASAPAVHMGTALNKVLKDVLVKYKALRGYYAPFVPGYDTHGLPIENAVLKTVKGGRSAITALALRERCAEHAQTNVDGQEEQFKRLGVLADWKNRYLTMDKEFEAAQVRVFAAMAHKGYLYKGLKPVHWCPNCETALANAEVEEKDYTCESVHVLFKLADSSRDRLPGFVPEGARVSFVAWTTTPWSLPGNTALAVNADLEYDFLETGEHGVLVVARALRDEFLQAVGLSYVSLLGCVKGRELEHVDARHPWLDRLSPVVLSRHVLPTMGTGVVHLAPGFGAEDYKVGRAYKLAVLCPMDGKGLLTQETGPFAGMHFEKANAAITEHLRALNKLLHSARYTHKYPHCWRCEKPLVERATPQWFASVNACKDAALAAVDAVEWLPATGHNRILGFLEERDDWCVSRQRAWGVPLPVFDCQACGEPLMTAASVERVACVFEQEGSNSWWQHEAEHFLGNEFACAQCGGRQFSKEMDTMDVWFDSGVSHAAVVDRLPELRGSPFEMVLEGSDQHRGWFQSLLWTSVMLNGHAPYKTVLTHGFVLDEKGEKMSKKKGNVVNPDDVVRKYGADVLRLWVASVNYCEDMRVGDKMLAALANDYGKLRNTMRFLLGNLNDFDPACDRVPLEQLNQLDRFMLHRLHQVVEQVEQNFERFEFHKVCQALQNFCVVDVSSLYFDVVKDRLYTHGRKSLSRRSAQTVLEQLLQVLVRLMMPVTPHLAEDVWQHMSAPVRQAEADTESVLLASFPDWTASFRNDELADRWVSLLKVRSVSNKALELARAQSRLGKTQEAQVVLTFESEELAQAARELGCELASLLMTAATTVEVDASASSPSSAGDTELLWAQSQGNGVRVTVFPAAGRKCARCWNYRDTVSGAARHPEVCAPCASVLQEVELEEVELARAQKNQSAGSGQAL